MTIRMLCALAALLILGPRGMRMGYKVLWGQAANHALG